MCLMTWAFGYYNFDLVDDLRVRKCGFLFKKNKG